MQCKVDVLFLVGAPGKCIFLPFFLTILHSFVDMLPLYPPSELGLAMYA